MKKNVIVILCLILALSLVACGNTTTASVSSQSVSNPESTTSSESTTSGESTTSAESTTSSESSSETGLSSQTEQSSISPENEFNVTAQEFIGVLDKRLAADKYKKISDLKPKVSDITINGIGSTKTYNYLLGSGVQLILYTDPANDKLVQVFFNIIKAETTKESMKVYGFTLGVTEAYMAGEQASEVDSKLNLDNTTKDEITFATSDYCEFSYIVNKDNLMLLITPRKF